MSPAYDASFAALADAAGVELLWRRFRWHCRGRARFDLPVTLEPMITNRSRRARRQAGARDRRQPSAPQYSPRRRCARGRCSRPGPDGKLEGGQSISRRAFPVPPEFRSAAMSAHYDRNRCISSRYRVPVPRRSAPKPSFRDARALQDAGAALLVVRPFRRRWPSARPGVGDPTSALGAGADCWANCS